MHSADERTIELDTQSMQKLMLFSLLGVAIYMAMVTVAYATTSPMGAVMCSIANIMYGNLGRGLSVLAVMVVGVGATMGKVSWGLAITVAVGIAVLFGSNSIAALLINNSATFSGNWQNIQYAC